MARETDDGGQVMVSVGGLQNKAWAEDTSKFGYKMLVKMGWKAGKGVGKDLQGQASHLKVARRSESLGVGCSLAQAETQGWSETSQGFSDVLAALNKSYQGKEEDSEESEKSERKEKKKAKKSKKDKRRKEKKASSDSRKVTISRRIHYRKRQQNKDVKGYNSSDMSAILGVPSS